MCIRDRLSVRLMAGHIKETFILLFTMAGACLIVFLVPGLFVLFPGILCGIAKMCIRDSIQALKNDLRKTKELLQSEKEKTHTVQAMIEELSLIHISCVDYSGYDQTAEFRSFDYKELD